MAKRLLITPGEPAGIGPDLLIQLAQTPKAHEWLIIADPKLLIERAKQLNLPLTIQISEKPLPRVAGTLPVFPVALTNPAQPGTLDPQNADYVITTLREAVRLIQQQAADAIVTGPVQKSVLNTAGKPFLGHTEFFAEITNTPQTVMLFVVQNQMKVALATTHLSLAEVPKALTADRLTTTIRVLHQGLKDTFRLADPKILVCGLNPHAGEGGILGQEEISVIRPVLTRLQAQGLQLTGPAPADTAFTPHQLANHDAILAMYHDQALPVVKYAGFSHAVNVTLGLPFVRTSVDHGTALDLAGRGTADPGSFAASIDLALDLIG